MGSKYVSGYIRMFRIDEMLRGGESVKLKDMAMALGVSTRTVSRDIEFMRKELLAPIRCDKATNTYSYFGGSLDDENPYFSLTDFKYSQNDLSALTIANDVMFSLFGMTYYGSGISRGMSSLLRHVQNMPYVSRRSVKNRVLLALPAIRNEGENVAGTFMEAMDKNLCVVAKSGDELLTLRPIHLILAWENWYVLYVTKKFEDNRDFHIRKLSDFPRVRVASANESKLVKDVVSVVTEYDDDGGVMFVSHAKIRDDILQIEMRHAGDDSFMLEYSRDKDGNLSFIENESTMLSGHLIEIMLSDEMPPSLKKYVSKKEDNEQDDFDIIM